MDFINKMNWIKEKKELEGNMFVDRFLIPLDLEYIYGSHSKVAE